MIEAQRDDIFKEFWLRTRDRGLIGCTLKDGRQVALKDMTDQEVTDAFYASIGKEPPKEENHYGE